MRPSNYSIRFWLPMLILSGALYWISGASAQRADGVFTTAQARRGEAIYDKACSSCHGLKLEGVTASPLSGASFARKWGSRSVDDLLYVTRTSMPEGRPGSLTPQAYVDVLSYICERNGLSAGPRELPPDSASLKKIPFAAKADARPSASTAPAVSTATGTLPTGQGPTQAELMSAATNTADWMMSNRDYGGQRFVDLKQITPANASTLRPTCMYQAGDTKAFHNNPIVYKGVMYITTPYTTHAFSATDCREKWRHEWKPKGIEGWPPNRGLAIKDGILVRGLPDGYIIAMNAETGKVIWEKKHVVVEKNEGGFNMAPLIFEDLILIGPGVSENGVKGWVAAYKLQTGEQVWRFNTVPDDGEPGSESWTVPDSKLHGGGAVWAPLALDAEKGILYVPVSNPAPDLYIDARPGTNLYTCSLLALDARTGKYKWHYQLVPGDFHDYDTTQVSPLFTTEVKGRKRNLVATAGKDGVLHVLDRDSHEHLYELPVTTRSGFDVPLTTEGVHVCPGVFGGVQWNGPSFNPGTNMLYVNSVDWCGTFKKAAEYRVAGGRSYFGGSYNGDDPSTTKGWLTAVNASTGQVAWKYQSERPMLAAVTTTSGGVIFTGELTGNMLVLDAKTGKVVYRFNTGGVMDGGVISYGIGGKQYVAVATGSASAFWMRPTGSSTIVVFSLPDSK